MRIITAQRFEILWVSATLRGEPGTFLSHDHEHPSSLIVSQ